MEKIGELQMCFFRLKTQQNTVCLRNGTVAQHLCCSDSLSFEVVSRLGFTNDFINVWRQHVFSCRKNGPPLLVPFEFHDAPKVG